MTKTKRIFLILSFLFVFAIMAFAIPSTVALAYAEEEGVEAVEEQPSEEVTEGKDWAAWVKEKLVPAIVLVVSGALTIYIAISPILVKVKKASDKFKEATKDVNDTARNGDDNAKKIEAFTTEASAKLQAISDDFTNKFRAIDERISRIEQSSQNTEAITRIGFGNMEELVQKGYAAEVEKVGKNNEQDKESAES